MTAPDPQDDRRQIQTMADRLQFAHVGIAPARPSEFADYVREWLDQGHHGEMAWLAEHVEKRVDPTELMPGARSIIVVADRYPAPDTTPDPGASPRGRLARYGLGRDYHKVLKKRLFQIADDLRERWPDETFQVATDTAPVLEHEHAARAGIGFTGKHTLTIHPRTGSWLLLGEIVTTLELPTDPESAGIDPDHPLAFFGDHFQGCGTCTRCIDACPTDCIRPWQLDAERCISYLTIEHRGPIDPELHPQMGNWLGGCDVCQEVCPFNRDPADEPSPHPDYTPDPVREAGLPLAEVIHWDEADRLAALAGSSLTRIKLEPMRRNALIAAGNILAERDDPQLLSAVKKAAEGDQPPLVRQTAHEVLKRLNRPL